MDEKVLQVKGKLIVSCQALPHERLHSSFIMEEWPGRRQREAPEGSAQTRRKILRR